MRRCVQLAAALVLLFSGYVATAQDAPRDSGRDSRREAIKRKAKPAAEGKAEDKPAEKTKTAQAGGEEPADEPAAPPAGGQPEAAGPPLPDKAPGAIAVVDVDRVEGSFPRLQGENAKLDAWRREKKAYLDNLRQYVFLTDAEFGRLMEVLAQDRLTADDQKTLDDLREANKRFDGELNALLANRNRNENEEGRYHELKGLLAAGEKRFQEKYEDLNSQYDGRLKAVLKDLWGEVEQVVADIAREMELGVVLQSEYVLYGGLDITERVIERLQAAPEQAAEEGE